MTDEEFYRLPRLKISASDWKLAQRIGLRRYEESQRRHLPGRAGCKPDLMQDIQGAAAEVAYARLIRVEPDLKVNVGLVADIAGVHVRGTHYKTGGLIFRPADCEDGCYVLMVGADRDWRYAGKIRGREAKKRGKLYGANGRDPCRMVSQEDLDDEL